MPKYRRSSPATTADLDMQRGETLRSLAILDTAPEPCFDTLVQLTASSLESESAGLMFLDEKRAWIKSWAGGPKPAAALCDQLARQVVREDRVLVFRRSESGAIAEGLIGLEVHQGCGAGFEPSSGSSPESSTECFVGAPVRLAGGHTLGILWVISPQTTLDVFSEQRLNLLEDLAQLIADQLELRALRLHAHPASAATAANWSPFSGVYRGTIPSSWPQAADIRRGLDLQQFVLHYQPEIELATRRVVGLEALIRWQHPERGMVPPMEFIPVAEENGMILPLGDWGIGEACRQMRVWLDRWPEMDSLRVCVNLSARQFARTGLADHVLSLLAQNGLSPHQLGLELTESSLCSNQAEAAEMLMRLHRLGVSLHMDDFGTGYSSLSHLHRFPFDVLKIDRSFVQRMQAGEQALQIVHTILELARVMGMDVVAEGIETGEQLRLLQEMGCRYGQGYLFSPPQPVEAIPEVLYALDPSFPDPSFLDTPLADATFPVLSTGAAQTPAVGETIQ